MNEKVLLYMRLGESAGMNNEKNIKSALPITMSGLRPYLEFQKGALLSEVQG